MNSPMIKTDYTMQNIDNSEWKRIFKAGKVFSLCISEEEGLHSIWQKEGSVADDFYVASKDGSIYKVDRGSL